MTAPPPSRTPARTVAQPDNARAALRYALVVIAGLVLLLVLVAGCGAAPPLPPAAPSTIAPTTPAPAPTTTAVPTTTPAATPHGTTGSDEGGRGPAAPAPAPHAAPKQGARPAGPIWPAANQASATQLQNQVDGGRQPWLLDPTEVAVSYAGAVLGYRDPGVFPIGTGRVDVQDGRSPAKATITLGQTVRRGDGGIWLVTGVQKR